MPKTKNRGHRETRKPQRELPDVPDLGNLSMPRKGNRAAARYVATVGNLWDRRRADRKARKRALGQQSAEANWPVNHRLSRRQKQWLLAHLPGWSVDTSTDALRAPAQTTTQQLDELVKATHLPYVQRAVLKVRGLNQEECQYVTARAPKTMRFILVDTLMKSQQTIRVPRIA